MATIQDYLKRQERLTTLLKPSIPHPNSAILETIQRLESQIPSCFVARETLKQLQINSPIFNYVNEFQEQIDMMTRPFRREAERINMTRQILSQQLNVFDSTHALRDALSKFDFSEIISFDIEEFESISDFEQESTSFMEAVYPEEDFRSEASFWTNLTLEQRIAVFSFLLALIAIFQSYSTEINQERRHRELLEANNKVINAIEKLPAKLNKSEIEKEEK